MMTIELDPWVLRGAKTFEVEEHIGVRERVADKFRRVVSGYRETYGTIYVFELEMGEPLGHTHPVHEDMGQKIYERYMSSGPDGQIPTGD